MPAKGLHSAASSCSQAEKRQAERFPSGITANWRALGEAGTTRTGIVKDVSSTGLSLSVDERPQPGSALVVQLKARGERFASPVLVRVRRVAEQPSGGWLVGCSLARRLTADELAELVPQPRRGTVSRPDGKRSGNEGDQECLQERRLSIRLPGEGRTVLVAGIGERNRPQNVVVLDHSEGGMCLAMPKPLPVGTVLRVQVNDLDRNCCWVFLWVRSVRSEGDFWATGCQFFELTPSRLRMLPP